MPRFEALALLPDAEQLKALASRFGARLSPETREAFRPSLAPDLRVFSAQRASVLLTTLRRELADRRATLRQELEAREAEASRELEAHRAAAGREIAGLEEQLREMETWAEQFGIPRQRPAPVTAPAPAVSVAPSPTPEPEPVDPPAPGGQAELVRLFFQEVYKGRPSSKLGYRVLHERMEEWVVEKNGSDSGNRRAASETTIRNVRNACAMRAQP